MYHCWKVINTRLAGPLRVYRAPGSVAFLSCSSALRPILPKSQCWEVEMSSTFVLQIRPPQYWRIELPHKTPEERRWAESFRDVLGKVLLFEKTPCPFKRTFTVALPEPPKTPVKKKPWRPVERSRTASSPLTRSELRQEGYFASPTPASSSASSPAPRLDDPPSPTLTHPPPSPSNFESCTSPLEGVSAVTQTVAHHSISSGQPEERRETQSLYLEPSLQPSLMESSSAAPTSAGKDVLDEAMSTEETSLMHRRAPALRLRTTDTHTTPSPVVQNSNRSATTPALSIVTTSPSKQTSKSPLKASSTVESDYEFSSSVDSFHSVQSWHSPLAPPSPPASGPSSPVSMYPYPHDNITVPKRPNHTREVSELTATPQSPRVWDVSTTPENRSLCRSISPTPKTPTLIPPGSSSDKSDDEPSEVLTPPNHTTTITRTTVRHRTTTSSNSRRRELSPLPAAVNLFSPTRRSFRRLRTARHLPTAIIQKTCEILMSPPSHLLQLMLNIAARIAAGEWRGFFSGSESEEDVSWDFQAEEVVDIGRDGQSEDSWMEEDDFGVRLPAKRGRVATKGKTKTKAGSVGGSWEVD